MPDYAEVAGVTSMYANGMGHQSHTSTSPLYDSCGAYATTSLIGTTNIYHQNRHYDNASQQQQQQHHLQQAAHYNNVIRSGPFVYPNKKTSSTSLNTPKLEENVDGGVVRDKLNNTFGGNRNNNNTLSFGIRNRLMKMNITENKMDILINNLGPKGSVNGGVKSVIQKALPQTGNAEPVNPIPPPTPNLGSTRRNQFLGSGKVNGQQKKSHFPNEPPPPPPPPQIMKSYLDPATDDEEEWTQEGDDGQRSCDRVNGNVNSNHNNNNNNNNSTSNCNSPRNKSQRQQLLAGDNQSLTAKNQTPPHKSSKSLNSSSSSSSSPYHMINHGSRNGGGHQDSSGSSSSSTSTTCPNTNNTGGNGGWNSASSNGSASSPLTKNNFAGSDNQINGSPNYMKSFGKTDNV